MNWMMRPIAAGLCGLTWILVAGCNGDGPAESADATASPAPPAQTEAVAGDTDPTADSTEAAMFTSAENPPLMPEILVPDSWLRPIEENENFFAPPKVSLTVQETGDSKTEYENVRLLGFAVSLENPAVRKAILKIGRAMFFMAPGEEEAGIKVVGMTRYTVHLERDGERWSLALHEQPIVNAPVVPEVHSRRERGTIGATAGAGRMDSHGASTAAQVPGMPEMPDLPGLEDLQDGMPSIPGLPGAEGEDSGIPGLPGIDGQDGMPQLPGMDGQSGMPEIPGMEGGAGGGGPGMGSSGGGLPELPGMGDQGSGLPGGSGGLPGGGGGGELPGGI